MGTKLSPKYLNKAIKAGMKKGKPDINLDIMMIFLNFIKLAYLVKNMGGDPAEQILMLPPRKAAQHRPQRLR